MTHFNRGTRILAASSVMLAASLWAIADEPFLKSEVPAPRRPEGRVAPLEGIRIQGSPFGFHPGSANNYSYLEELGAVWSRNGSYVIWDWVDPSRSGHFSFRNAIAPPNPDVQGSGGPIDYDRQWSNPPPWVQLMANVCPSRNGGEFASESEKDTYRRFVSAMVERYDGDSDLGCALPAPDCYVSGDGEYPSEETVQALAANPVLVWQVCNQLTDTCVGADCRTRYAASFAEVQSLSYEAMHEANDAVLVLMAGDSSADMYPPVFQALGGVRAMDVVDIHQFGTADSWDPSDDLQILRDGLSDAGFRPDSFAFWITESGTYSGDPVDDRSGTEGPPLQSESEQAAGLVKRIVAPLAAGVGKVFWAWSILEGFGCDCCIFDYTGLVYDGNTPPNANGCDANDAYDRGSGVKKLAYYSMELLIRMLDGATEVETIQETETAHVDRFVKKGRSIWVAWANAEQGDTVLLDTGAAVRVRITDAVPAATYGDEISDATTAFPSREEYVNGALVLDLGPSPVFVEEIE